MQDSIASASAFAVRSRCGSGEGATPEVVQPRCPERLIEEHGHGDRGDARTQSGPGGPCSRVMHHCRHAGKQPVVRQVADEQDVVADWGQPCPARLDHGPHAGTSNGGRDQLGQRLTLGRGHAAEADEDRRRPGLQEVEQPVWGCHSVGLAGHQYPVTCTSADQSSGRGVTVGLKPWKIGHRSGGLPPAGSVVVAVGRWSWVRSHGSI